MAGVLTRIAAGAKKGTKESFEALVEGRGAPPGGLIGSVSRGAFKGLIQSEDGAAPNVQLSGAQAPDSASAVASEKIESLSKTVAEKFKLLGQQLQVIQANQAKQQDVLNQTQSNIGDASKALAQLNSYAGNIASNIQNIADKMGAYVTTLKETKEALQQERQATAPSQATEEEAGSAGGIVGRIKEVGGKGARLVGALGSGFLSGAGKALAPHAKRAGTAIAKGAKSVGQAAAKGGSAILKLMTNPKMLVVALVAAVGYGIYSYFTDEGFKKSVSEYFAKALDLGKEYILDPMMNLFSSMKEGLYNVIATVFEFYAGISIPVPEFLQKLGLPAKLTPYGFLAGAAQDLRASAAESKQAREAAAAEKVKGGGGASGGGGATGSWEEGAATPAPSGSSSGPDASPASPSEPPAAAATVASGAGSGGDEGPAIVKVIEVGKGYNVVELEDGSVVRREGPWNWRNNNPGNMTYNAYTRSLGALEMPPGADPGAARYAIFPTYAAGRAAKAALLFSGKNYKNLLLSEAIARWAPPNENDTKKYQQTVLAAVGGQDARMGELSAQQQQAVLSAMEKMEGYKKGKVTVVKAGTGKVAQAAPVAAPTSAPPSSAAPTLAATPIKTDSSLAVAPPASSTSGSSDATQAAGVEPSTGAAIGEASADVAAKKNAPAQDTTVIDNTASSSESAVNVSGGGAIPSPIANRGTLDQFNYFNPIGQMKR